MPTSTAKQPAYSEQFKAQVVSELASHFGINEQSFSVESTLHDIFEPDELDIVELEMAFEGVFDIDIPDEDLILPSHTVLEVVETLHNLVSAQNPSKAV